jgi:hypothetical protein
MPYEPTRVEDDYMKDMLSRREQYTVVILYATSRAEPGDDKIVWEHGRRNFGLRKDGKLLIVCPLGEGGPASGIYIFGTGLDETEEIMRGDPAVRAGIFTYEMYTTKTFTGDSLRPRRDGPAGGL